MKHVKRPNPKKLQEQCDAWNKTHPIRSPVWYHPVIGQMFPAHLYETRTPAEVLSGHTAVVWLFGKAGCVALDALSDCPHTLITEGLRRGLFAPGQVTKKS